jgi:hypothetical protein
MNTTLQICLLFRNRYLVGSSRSEYLVVDIFEYLSLFSKITRCLPILPSVLRFCLMLSHFARCFAVSSVFSILLGVFSFGWGSQNYKHKFAFTTRLYNIAWSN